MSETTAITLYNPAQLMQQIRNQQETITALYQGAKSDTGLAIAPVMQDGQHFGTIPGTQKPTLLKAGAELLNKCFGYYADYQVLDKTVNFGDDGSEPLFFYQYKCVLRRVGDDVIVGTGVGSCNSRESKYGYRWVDESEVPANLDKSKLNTRSSSISEFEFAIKQAKTPAQDSRYGKPEEYWQAFNDAIADGTAVAGTRNTSRGASKTWEISSVSYQVPNPEIASQLNTIDKMAQKRALIAATLNGTAASEFFTQDVEDLPEFSMSTPQTNNNDDDNVIDVTPIEETPKPQSQKPSNVTQKPDEWWQGNGVGKARYDLGQEDFNMVEVNSLDIDPKSFATADEYKAAVRDALTPLAPTGTDDNIPF